MLAVRGRLLPLLLVVAIVPALVGFQTTAAPPVAHAAPGDSAKVMVVGDSISQGSSGDYTWRYRLYKQLAGAGVTVDMVGPRRDVFDNVANRQGDDRYADPDFDSDHDAVWGQSLINAKQTIQAEVTGADPDYLLLLMGINDLSFSTNAAQTEANLR